MVSPAALTEKAARERIAKKDEADAEFGKAFFQRYPRCVVVQCCWNMDRVTLREIARIPTKMIRIKGFKTHGFFVFQELFREAL